MMVAFLKKTKEIFRGLRVKEINAPLATSEVLGSGIDVMTLPEGHLSCVRCSGYKFEAWVLLDQSRIELGCMECNASYRLLFPVDCPMPGKSGRFSCNWHPTKGMVIIHNVDVLSIGCERCYTEIQFQLKTDTNLILPGDIQ